MLADLDLSDLARLQGPERAVLSLYFSGPDARGELARRYEAIEALLADEPEELAHFEQNRALAAPLVENWPADATGLAVFTCWAADVARAVPLPLAVEDRVWVGDAPYIRPLAELQDEYEDFAIAVVDAHAARLFRVSAEEAEAGRRIRGDVKNRVKKGGWSQKRYARRREKQLEQYAAEVAEALTALDAEQPYSRLVLLGSAEAIQAVEAHLPRALQDKLAGSRTISADASDQDVLLEALDVSSEGERASEQALWAQIREQGLGPGLAAFGATRVLDVLREGRAEALLVDRGARFAGTRCRACGHLVHGTPQTCQSCGSADVFPVDLVEAFVEMAARTGADVDFADPFEGLARAGHVAALLRW